MMVNPPKRERRDEFLMSFEKRVGGKTPGFFGDTSLEKQVSTFLTRLISKIASDTILDTSIEVFKNVLRKKVCAHKRHRNVFS